jgi:phage terminase large subunit
VIKTQRPEKIQKAYEAAVSGLYRWIVLRGGRGSSKSWGIAEIIVIMMLQGNEQVLCARYQKNKTDSSIHRIFKKTIARFGLLDHFIITNNYIRYKHNGSEINYIGLAVNPDEIKSYEGYTIGWVEEGNSVPDKTLFKIYPPTVRGDTWHGRDPVIFASYNPEHADDPIHHRAESGGMPNAYIDDINYWDNPFFPEVLRKDMEHCKRTDHETYLWLWRGGLRLHSEAQIFNNKCRVARLPVNPPTNDIRFGADWSNGGADPHCLVRFYVINNTLYVDRAQYDNCDIEELPARWSAVKGSRDFDIRADNAQGDAIAGNGLPKYMRNHGFKIITPKKLRVQTGIFYIRQFDEIVIDYRLTRFIKEMTHFSWLVDKKTERILPEVENAYKHGPDSIRYGLQPDIARGRIWN